MAEKLVIAVQGNHTYYYVSLKSINIKTHPHLKKVRVAWKIRVACDDILIMEDEPTKGVRHLRVRFTGVPIHSFNLLQQIKNDLWGKDTIAIEVYPKHADYVDGSNTYHLWTWKGIEVPNLKKLYKYVAGK